MGILTSKEEYNPSFKHSSEETDKIACDILEFETKSKK
jgi:hypothetical protein